MTRIKDKVTIYAADDATGRTPRVTFRYLNWRGEEHEYVVDVESVTYGRSGDSEVGPDWYLHGDLVMRDGDLRPDMGPTRRRSFRLSGIKNIEGEE